MFHHLLDGFFASVPYLLSLGTILLGLFEIIKDREDYKKARLSRPVAIIFVVVGALQIVGLRRDARDRKDAEKNLSDLAGQVKAANKAQTDNTALYVDSFGKMSDKLSGLEVEVKTDALQKKIGTLQSELQNTQRALAPGPKAELSFTFLPFPKALLGQTQSLVITKEVAPATDGALHMEFTVVNLTEVDALDGDLNLVICNGCKYAKEPPLFDKLATNTEQERTLHFSQVLARTEFVSMSVDILPPPFARTLTFGVIYRCRTCVLPKSATGIMGTVQVVNRLP
jgi:hypothetical protein